MAPEDVAYQYMPETNPNGNHLPGVPLRDLTLADIEDMARWLRRSVAASPYYSRTEAGPLPPPDDEPIAEAVAATVPGAVRDAARRQRQVGPTEVKEGGPPEA